MGLHLQTPRARLRRLRGRPTRRLPGLTSEQAAHRVVGALEDRTLTRGTVPGRLGEWFNLVAPRLSDAAYHRIDERVPDSRAERGPARDSRRPRE